MWKYINKEQCKQFLLSLNLIDDDINDEEKIRILYSISNNIKNNYMIYKIPKRDGSYRTIYEPNYLLKKIQKNILENILNNKSISKYAKAYHKGISLNDNARFHINKKIILKLDIKDFFESICFIDIYNSCFQIEYFPKSIGYLLTYLCTYNEKLPQGAPTSSYISNLVMKDFDEVIGRFCEDNNISYTRYSDDMTFSGDFLPNLVIGKVRKMLYKLGLELNDKKTCVISNDYRQVVTGIVVNKKLNIDIDYRKKIRQEIYYIKKYGVVEHFKYVEGFDNTKDYLLNLYGRILYVLQIRRSIEFKGYMKYLKSQFDFL